MQAPGVENIATSTCERDSRCLVGYQGMHLDQSLASGSKSDLSEMLLMVSWHGQAMKPGTAVSADKYYLGSPVEIGAR